MTADNYYEIVAADLQTSLMRVTEDRDRLAAELSKQNIVAQRWKNNATRWRTLYSIISEDVETTAFLEEEATKANVEYGELIKDWTDITWKR